MRKGILCKESPRKSDRHPNSIFPTSYEGHKVLPTKTCERRSWILMPNRYRAIQQELWLPNCLYPSRYYDLTYKMFFKRLVTTLSLSTVWQCLLNIASIRNRLVSSYLVPAAVSSRGSPLLFLRRRRSYVGRGWPRRRREIAFGDGGDDEFLQRGTQV